MSYTIKSLMGGSDACEKTFVANKITVTDVESYETILDKENGLVLLKDGNYPIFAPNADLNDLAETVQMFYIPAEMMDRALEEKGESCYKRWAQEVTKKQVKRVIKMEHMRSERCQGTMWVANWECSMLCYEVVANAWDVIYNAPRLGSSICAKTSENQMMSLGTMQVQLARDNRQTLIEKFKIKVVTQEKCAYTDNTDFLKVKSETKPEVDANELEAIGWHKQSEDNAYAILASKAKGIVPLYLLKAPEVAAMYMIRKEHRGLLNGITGGYEVEAEQREGAKIAGKCCEMDGALLKAMEELGGLPKDRWPLKMMVNIERMDRSRRRELRNSITYAAGWNDWGTWSNKSKGGLHFLMYGTKEEAFDVARKTIDIGTMGRGTSWKIADLSKKPKHETVEEEKTETERLQEMVKRVETEESYRNYLLYKIKILEKAIKTLEGSVK